MRRHIGLGFIFIAIILGTNGKWIAFTICFLIGFLSYASQKEYEPNNGRRVN